MIKVFLIILTTHAPNMHTVSSDLIDIRYFPTDSMEQCLTILKDTKVPLQDSNTKTTVTCGGKE